MYSSVTRPKIQLVSYLHKTKTASNALGFNLLSSLQVVAHLQYDFHSLHAPLLKLSSVWNLRLYFTLVKSMAIIHNYYENIS